MKVILSGGGTGGHIFPAIAIAKAIQVKAAGAEILFVGAKGKMEMEKVPQAGFPIRGLWISGFHRKLTVRNLSFPLKLVHSYFSSRQLIYEFKPDVVIGTGGYASAPMINAAASAKIPTLILEANSYAGVANKIFGKLVNVICVAYPNMDKFFPKDKIAFTGNPVKSEFHNLTAETSVAKKELNIHSDQRVISILGGSLGAGSINNCIIDHHDTIAAHPEITWLWQCGNLHKERCKNTLTANLPNVILMPFIDKMETVYQASDLLITRAGALTISEICVVGAPAILVPSPNVAEDHQTKNAKYLSSNGAAVLIKDNEAQEKLIDTAIALVNAPEALATLRAKAKSLGKPNATNDIVDRVFKLLTEKK